MRQTAGYRVLVIEAQAETRRNMCGYLTQLGYRADAAGSGAEGLTLLGGNVYDAVLFDAAAEGTDEIGFRDILTRFPDVSVVVMSATPSVKAVIASLRSGAFDYIIKPYEIQELALILPRATERSQENRRRRELFAGGFHGVTGSVDSDEPLQGEPIGSGHGKSGGYRREAECVATIEKGTNR